MLSRGLTRHAALVRPSLAEWPVEREVADFSLEPNGSALCDDDKAADQDWIFTPPWTASVGKTLVAEPFADDRGVITATRDSRRVAPSGSDGRREVFGLDLAEAATIVETARDLERIGTDDDLAAPVNVAGIILEGSLKQSRRRQHCRR